MRVVAKPIDVYAVTDIKGQIYPVMLQLEDKKEIKKLKIDRIVSITMEKLDGNALLVYNCQSLIKGLMRPFELKYDMNTCRWTLFKI